MSIKEFNAKFALLITEAVGSMWCAYAFTCLALISLPEAIKGGTAPLVAWIAQTFLQLVLLSVIMVGQDVASQKAEKRAEEDHEMIKAQFEDLKVVLNELKDLQADNDHEQKEIDELQESETKEAVTLQRLTALIEELKGLKTQN